MRGNSGKETGQRSSEFARIRIQSNPCLRKRPTGRAPTGSLQENGKTGAGNDFDFAFCGECGSDWDRTLANITDWPVSVRPIRNSTPPVAFRRSILHLIASSNSPPSLNETQGWQFDRPEQAPIYSMRHRWSRRRYRPCERQMWDERTCPTSAECSAIQCPDRLPRQAPNARRPQRCQLAFGLRFCLLGVMKMLSPRRDDIFESEWITTRCSDEIIQRAGRLVQLDHLQMELLSITLSRSPETSYDNCGTTGPAFPS